jgi:hypothetical protein
VVVTGWELRPMRFDAESVRGSQSAQNRFEPATDHNPGEIESRPIWSGYSTRNGRLGKVLLRGGGFGAARFLRTSPYG